MSEFMDMNSVSKLIGSPAGYIGYGDENQLTDRIRRKPYTLVLLDEIEKAHPAVLNVLLQVMDDGCLTDASGRNVSFKNALIIMTSNTDHLSSGKAFSPEFLNRLDGIIPFSPLGKSEVEEIAELELAKTIKCVEEKGALLTVSPRFKDKVVDEGFDIAYGARPLRRAVGSLLGDELANSLLSQSLAEGEHVHVDIDRDQEVVVSRSGSKCNSRRASDLVSPEQLSPCDSSQPSITREISFSDLESSPRPDEQIDDHRNSTTPFGSDNSRDLECQTSPRGMSEFALRHRLSLDTSAASDSTTASVEDRNMFMPQHQAPSSCRPQWSSPQGYKPRWATSGSC
jgi:hypothetical protein